MTRARNTLRLFLALLVVGTAAATFATGCSLVVSFDRDLITDAGGDSGPRDGGRDAGRDAGSDARVDAPMMMCGNTTVEGTEDCDDGNMTPDDGCENDCTFSCTIDGDCDNSLECDGTETCDSDHVCQDNTDLTDGAACDDVTGDPLEVCFGGVCILPECGNSVPEPGEQCDDGANGNDADGCTDLCERTCTMNSDCDDMNQCSGTETCVADVCVAGTPLSNGTACTSMSGTRCFMAACIVPNCGNTIVEPGEECDDGRDGDNDDGCRDDCTFTCEINSECSDTNACTGIETCTVASHTCAAGTPVDCSSMVTFCSNSVCNTTTGACVPTPRNGGMACSDSNTCTTGTTCMSGTCGTPTLSCPSDETCAAEGVCMCGVTPGAGGSVQVCSTARAPDCNGTGCVCTGVGAGVACGSGETCGTGPANCRCGTGPSSTTGEACAALTAPDCVANECVCATASNTPCGTLELCVAGGCRCGPAGTPSSTGEACTGPHGTCNGASCGCGTVPTDTCVNSFVCASGNCSCNGDTDCIGTGGTTTCNLVTGRCDCDGVGAGGECARGQVCTGAAGVADCTDTGGSV